QVPVTYASAVAAESAAHASAMGPAPREMLPLGAASVNAGSSAITAAAPLIATPTVPSLGRSTRPANVLNNSTIPPMVIVLRSGTPTVVPFVVTVITPELPQSSFPSQPVTMSSAPSS